MAKTHRLEPSPLPDLVRDFDHNSPSDRKATVNGMNPFNSPNGAAPGSILGDRSPATPPSSLRVTKVDR